jgi:hypothetical protein
VISAVEPDEPAFKFQQRDNALLLLLRIRPARKHRGFHRTLTAVILHHDAPGTLGPAFLWADEAQNFIIERDAEYQAVARSPGGCSV